MQAYVGELYEIVATIDDIEKYVFRYIAHHIGVELLVLAHILESIVYFVDGIDAGLLLHDVFRRHDLELRVQ